MTECDHCGDEIKDAGRATEIPGDQIGPDEPDRTLCDGCYASWTVIRRPRPAEWKDPADHRWTTADTAVEGRGSMTTYAVDRCLICGNLRIDHSAEIVEEVGRDA